jgi:hypothetical protein
LKIPLGCKAFKLYTPNSLESNTFRVKATFYARHLEFFREDENPKAFFVDDPLVTLLKSKGKARKAPNS